MTQIDYLDFKDVELIYTICGYETAWRHKLFDGKSIWCSLFKNEKHLKIMEYLEDLEYYWIDGPGFEVTRKVACKTVEDMLEHLDPARENDQKLIFYFTHSGTILKLLTFLGLYQDDFQLTADKLYQERKWQTSLIDTFSTNIVAVLYE
jgi:multiple inositol-polyphosphate phosphatase/2,3-bisphosphoglycerate 3-phosphatase